MFERDNYNKVIVGLLAGILIVAGISVAIFHQSPKKTDKIYTSALEDFSSGDYQNAYYLFSKISLFSNLKPIAIYHRAECAKMLDDDKSEIKQYQLLFNNYPKHALSLRSRYLAAQKLVKDKPQLAKKYFEKVIKQAPDSDYAIASEYYLGLIIKDKYENEKIVPKSAKEKAQNCFRHYLKQAPAGRHALNVVNAWLDFADDISKDDYLLMANTCYLFDDLGKARELLQKTDVNENWTLDVKIANSLKDIQRTKFLIENGMQKRSQYVDDEGVVNAIDTYLSLSNSKIDSINKLLAYNPTKGKDYLLSLKCANSLQKDKAMCYSNLYLTYPDGKFSADALSNIFLAKIKSGDILNAKKVGMDHLNKFPYANSTPMVMFWLGKLAERENNYNEYNSYYRSLIDRFPDSYYAYRAYLKLNHLTGPLLTDNISYEPVMFPYKYSKNNVIVKLIDLKDYDIISELTNNDEFVKSWVLYKNGDYSNSMLVARDAMDKIQQKPDRYDLRWRLVYPMIYYDEIKEQAFLTGNSAPLILSIIREESYFDPLAQSVVGAKGLMQLMPFTASEINSKYGLGLNLSEAIFNPYSNIRLGNYYYEFLRKNLEGHDISAIAAYNGGIGSIQKWKTSIRYNDTDEFVEQIPYPETKNYVKKVFRSYWNYIRVYYK